MACYSPVYGIKGEVNDNGKRPIIWTHKQGAEKAVVPCGKCIGCRLAYAKNWAVRCVHEAQMHERNCFVTLTFSEKYVPKDGNLDLRIWQLFMKRLRKKYKYPVRYFHAGEYGGKFGRPHHHAILFGHDFSDKLLSPNVVPLSSDRVLYVSRELSELWPFGFHSIGEVNYATASYVARYCLKKAEGGFHSYRDNVVGKRYQVDHRSGEEKIAEFTTMSRRPGVGALWFEKYMADVYPADKVVWQGKEMSPPRYYDSLLDKVDPDLLESLKRERESRIDFEESSDLRLIVKEECKRSELKTCVRRIA